MARRPEYYQPHLSNKTRKWLPEEMFRVQGVGCVYDEDKFGATRIHYPGCRTYYLKDLVKMGYILTYPLSGRYESRWKKV